MTTAQKKEMKFMEKNPEIKGRPDPSELRKKQREADERIKKALGKAAVKGSKA